MRLAARQRFADRRSAGIALGRAVAALQLSCPVALGLPRGGVPVAYEVACLLQAPLDVMVVRKIGMPGDPEFAIGAIALGNVSVRQPGIDARLHGLGTSFDALAARESAELMRRERLYRAGRETLDLRGKTAILVDDGLATGASMLAAARAARAAGAAAVIAAAPIASGEAVTLLQLEAEHVVALEVPTSLMAVGEWYDDFEQLEDEEVCALLAAATVRRETARAL